MTTYNPDGSVAVASSSAVSSISGSNDTITSADSNAIQLSDATVGQPYTITLSSNSSDDDEFYWQLVQAPPGMSLSPSSSVTEGINGGYLNQATLNWTPTATDSVDNDIYVRVEDGRGVATLVHYTVYLQGGNNPPVIAPIAPVSGTEGQAIVIPVSVSDADGNAVSTTVRNLPPGASYDAVNGQIKWTPGYTQAGTYIVTVVATDGITTVTENVAITVAQGFASPVLNPIPAQTLTEGTAFGLQLAGSMPGGMTEADGSTITLSYSAPMLPGGAMLDSDTGWFSWTPGYAQSGPITVPVTLIATYTPTDGGLPTTMSVTQNITMNVLATPVAPQFAPAQTYYTLEGQPLQLSVFAFDPANPDYQPGVFTTVGAADIDEVGTPSVTYEVTGLPPGALFDADSATINWTPGPTQAGTYNVTVVATSNGDGTGVSLSSTTTIPIVVEPVVQPPVVASISNASVAQGATLSIPLSATDASGNPVTFTVSGLPSFATFSQTGTGPDATGTLTFAPGTYQRGDYTITVTASDNGGGDPSKVQSSSTTFVLSATSFTEPPQLTAPPQVVAVTGQPLMIPLVATDMDQDPLTFAAQGLPAGAKIVQGTLYGQAYLEWTPPAGAALGTYNISLTVTDSGLPPANTPLPTDFVPIPNVVAADLNIVLKASNSAPQVLQVQANGQTVAGQGGTAVINTAEGQATSVNLLAADPDGDYVNWTAVSLPSGMTMTQTAGSNGQAELTLTWTPAMLASLSSTPGNPSGVYTVVVSAGDGMAQATQTLTFNVARVYQKPFIDALPTQIVDEGSTINFNLVANDPDGTTPVLSLLQDANTPAGVSFDPTTGYFEWTPPANTVDAFGEVSKTFNFTFAAVNGSQTTYQTVAVQVVHVDQAPQIFASNHSLIVGQSFNLAVVKGGNASTAATSDTMVVNDVDGAAQTQALTVAFNNLPAGATFNAQTGALNWTPGPGQIGDFQITANVTDSFGTTNTQTFTLRVAADASANAPVISINTTPSMAVQPGATVLTTVRASAFANIASIAVATSMDGGATWTNAALDGAGQFDVAPSAPGVVLVRVTATDVDGNTSTKTGSILVAAPSADAAPTLAWAGALTGNWGTGGDALAPQIISQASQLQAQIADEQLMGWQLQMAPVGTNQWTTIASQQDSAANTSGLVTLATIDPSMLANGVYELRLTAQNLIGGTSEIDSRIEIDSTDKNLTQATATDAIFQLGDNSVALTRSLPTVGDGALGDGSGSDFGNWQLPILSTQLTSDQPASNPDGSTAAWTAGAQVWLQVPSSLSEINAPIQYLNFTLGTQTQPLSNAPGAPVVVHPVFGASDGWTLTAVDVDADGNAVGAPNLQMEGGKLYDEVTGMPWQPAAYVLTGPDGTAYSLDAQGNITAITFTDGQQWLVSDAGIALVGGDPTQRIDFLRNAAGQIVSVSGPAANGGDTQNPSSASAAADQTILYEYDAAGRLELSRSLGSSGFGTTYGYNANGSLIVPAGGTIAANLGEPANWISSGSAAVANPTNTWSGTLSNTPVSLSYFIGDSEIASTVKMQGAAGSVILAVQTVGTYGSGSVNLDVAGATVLGTSTVGNVTTTLIVVTTAGMKLLTLSGTGSATLTISIAGDLNHDGAVDGTDAALLTQDIAAGNSSGDLLGDGQLGDADTEVLDANYGFASALAPQAIAQSGPAITTHTNLTGSVALDTLAQDDEGNPIFWTIVGATNGVASISADGQNLIFTPAPGYAGPATVTLQADDGFAVSAPIIVNVSVSGAQLQNINVTRLPTMTMGSTDALQITGNFADESGVLLSGNYVSIASSNSSVVSVDADGILHADGGGIATVTVSADGISAENVITSGTSPATPSTDDNGNELNVYPLSIDLPAGTGQRQIDVHSLTTDSSMGTDLSDATTGTQYFISDPSVASISPDGLIQAKAGGIATITVINGGLQGTLQLQVQAASVGPTAATIADGAVTTDGNGNTLMLGADILSADTTASISSVSLGDLSTPLPAPGILNALGAVSVDLGGASTSEPMQLALNVGTSLPAGTQVMFWQEGTINDANGVAHQTWWLVDNGVIGSDGLAHTASQPYTGITTGGNILVTSTVTTNNNTGAQTIKGALLDYSALWAQTASMAMMMDPLMALGALSVFSLAPAVTAVSYTIEGSYQLQIPQKALLPNSTVSIPTPPDLPNTKPAISNVQYNPTNRQLTITGQNFIPPGQSANNFQVQVWLEPTGDQLSQPTQAGAKPVNGLVWQPFTATVQSDGSLQITLPPGIALSQHDVYVERSALSSTPQGGSTSAGAGLVVDSDPVGAAPTTPSTDTIVTTATGIDVFQPASNFTPGANPQPVLLKQLTVDNYGNPLAFGGAYTQEIVFNEEGTLAYIAGRGDKIYVFDTETQDIVATYQVQGSNAPIQSLAVNDGWLYVAEGSNSPTGGELVRINVDETSPDFLKTQQTLIIPGAVAPCGYAGLAVNDGRYLAVTASNGAIPITNGPVPARGNVYVLDLDGVNTSDAIDSSNVATLNLADYPSANLGKGPLYITSGDDTGQFLISNSKDFDSGTAGVTFATDPDTGVLTGNATVVDTMLTPSSDSYQWLQATDQQNIQRAAGTVIVTYQGQTYELVADYNFLFNDPNFTDYNNYGLGKQIGGKIGIIEDPFGTNGGPVYLGATTPMPGIALQQLSVDQNGMLYATAFVEDTSGHYGSSDMFYDSLFVWNTGQLIQAALNAQASGRSLTVPVDQTSANQLTSTQIAAATPARYDSAGKGTSTGPAQLFGAIYGVGTYVDPQNVPTITLNNVPDLTPLAPSSSVQSSLPPKDQSNSTLDTAMIRLGAEATFLFEGIYAALRTHIGLDNSAQLAEMKEASGVLKTATYADGSAGAVIAKSVESVIKGLLEVPLEAIDVAVRVDAVLNSWVTGKPPADVPSLSQMAQANDAGATQGDLLKMAAMNTVMVTPIGVGVSSYNMTTAIIQGDAEGALTNAIGLGLGLAAGAKGGGETPASEIAMEREIKTADADLQNLEAGKTTESPGKLTDDGSLDTPLNQAPVNEVNLPEFDVTTPDAPESNNLLPEEVQEGESTPEELEKELEENTQQIDAEEGPWATDTAIKEIDNLNKPKETKDEEEEPSATPASAGIPPELWEVFNGKNGGVDIVDASNATPVPKSVITSTNVPPVKPLGRPIGGSKTQNARVQAEIKALQDLVGPDVDLQIRVNQAQINGAGQRVSNNRPDLQFTYQNKRYYVEYDTVSSNRGPTHANNLIADDPQSTVILITQNQNVISEGSNQQVAPLTQADIGTEVAAAEQYWLSAGASAAELAHANINIGNLPVGVAAQTVGTQITLSANGAGWGWYVDPNPGSNANFSATGEPGEFTANAGSAAAGKLDLLTVLIHEMGHVLGLSDVSDNDDAMALYLTPGVRRLPSADDIAQMLAASDTQLDTTGSVTSGIAQTIVNPPPTEAASGPYVVGTIQSSLANGIFAGGTNGWTLYGRVMTDGAGNAVLTNSANADAQLQQSFNIDSTDRYLEFTVANGLQSGNANGPQDAFDVAFDNANTGTSLVGTDGLNNTDGLLNIQADGTTSKASSVTTVTNADGSTTYIVDLQGALANGSVTATPATLSFDLAGFGNTQSQVTISNVELVQHPIALDQNAATLEDGSVTLNPVSADPTGSGATPTLQIVTEPAHGTLTQNADGTVSYVPDAHYYGSDSFQYSYTVDGETSNVATVSLSVNEVNYPPTAGNTTPSATVTAGQAYTFDPLAGSTDINGNAMTAVLDTPPADGTLVVNPNGTWTYTANNNYAGADQLVYHIDDGKADSQPVTYSFTVAPAHHAPVAQSGAVQVQEDGSLQIDFSQFGTDVDGNPMTATITSQPAHGSLTQNADGTWTYTPDQYYYGSDTLDFVLNDAYLSSQQATLNISVAKVEIAPTVADSSANLNELSSTTLNPLNSATDVNGDPLTAAIVTGPAHGTVTQNADGTWTYTPTGYFYGTDSFTYVVNDGADNSNVATVTLNVAKVEIAPTLTDSSANLNELSSTTLNPLANATDVNGDALTAAIVTGPAHGTVTQNADGTWTYTPTGYFYGTDSFTYVVNDGADNSNVATVTLNVAKVEIAPTLADGSANLNELGSTTLNPLDAATDVNGDPLTAAIVTGPAHGTVTQNADGTWTYTPTGYFYGTDSFTYVVNDGADNSNVATVTLNVAKVEIAPTLADGSANLNELGSTTLNPLAAATDVNGDPLTAAIVTGPAHGTVTQNADGTWTYTPTGYFYGTDSFTYVVNDGTDNSNVATVTLNVAKVEIAPTLTDSSASLNELGSTTLNPLANATDVNGDPLTAAIVTGPAHGTVTQNADGTWTYTPTGYFYGTDSFTYVVNDGTDNSNVATVTLNVAKVEIAPTLTDSSANLNELSSTTLNPLANATDVNGDALTAAIVTGPAHGTVTQNADGTWTYTPTGYFYGTDSFTYVVSDGVDSSNVATVTLNVNKVEIAPTLVNSSATLNEDGSTILKPLTSATDVNGDALTASVVSQPAHGKITINADGTWTYTPNQYFYGTDTFTYSVSDGVDSSNVATVTLNVNKVEIAPTLVNSSATLNEDGSTILKPLTSATDVNGDALTASVVSQPAHGKITVNADGTWTYTPNQYFYGTDTFTYSVSDGVASSNVATVSLTVNKVEIAPTLVNSSASLNEDGSTILKPLASATDVNGDALTASVVSQPAHGKITVNADGTWTYTPNQYFYGTDTFTYSVSDGVDTSNVATVSLTVNKVEIAPTLANGSASLNEDSSTIVKPLASATDVNGDALTASVVSQPAHGKITVNADGTWTYTPNQYFYGTDTFTYSVSDGVDSSNVATVTLNVNKVEIAPTLTNSSATLNEDSSTILKPLVSATDVNGDALTASVVSQPAHGKITVNADGTWTYTPNQYFYGTDTFTYSVSDGVASSNVATVTLNVNKVEIAPTLVNSSATLNEDGSTTLKPLISATDVNGDALTASVVSQPAHGKITVNADGTWTYTPNQYFYGTDTFTYSVSDGVDSSNVATVTLNVNKVEIAPTLANSSAMLNEDSSTILKPLASATDVNGDALTASVVSQPAHGKITVNADGTWTYTPNQYFYGTDTFTYSVSDGVASSNVATVTLNVNKVEIAPTLANSSATLNEDSSTILKPLTSATDVNGDALTASVVSQPAHGKITVNADGTWAYTPNQYFYGTDTFTYSVSDGVDSSNVATVSLTVNKVEIAPTLANSSATLNEDSSTILKPLASATDVNGDALTASVVSQPAHGKITVNADGTWTYTPNQYFYGTDTFTYSVSDGVDTSNIATVTLNVNKVEIAPTLANSIASLNEDSSAILKPLASATDVNGDALTASVVSQPAHGKITVNADGTWTYTPNQYFYGTDTFTYSVSDGVASSNVATVSLTVNKVEIAPTLVNSSASLNEDSSTILKPLVSATDVNGDALTASVVSQPAHGKITVNADGTWTYTPNQYFYGTDTFTYSVSDGIDTSNVATVTLNVNKVEIAPTLVNSSATVNENSSATLNLLASATDVNGDALAAVVVTQPAHGSVAQNASGAWIYTPTTGYYGADSFTYKVSDGVASSNVATVSLTVNQVQQAPVASTSTVTGTENTALTLQWSNFAISNPTDPNGALTLHLTALPAAGQLQSLVNGQWTAVAVGASFAQASIAAGNLRFVPAQYASGGPGYSQTGVGNEHQTYAAFGYTVSDGNLTSNAALVNININAVATAPTLTVGATSSNSQLFDTGWEDAPGPGSNLQSTLVTSSTLDGWSVVTTGDQLCGGNNGFEIWASGDQMQAANGQTYTVNAASGDGSKFLELNDAGSGQSQTLGITRQVTTVAGASYSLSFDLAGRLGFDTATTAISVLVDGKIVATYDPTSPNSSLDWQHANVSFTGTGGAQTISIVTSATERYDGGRGTLLDNIALNQTQVDNIGNEGSSIALQSISAALVDTDGSETLGLVLSGMPVGTTLSDGTHSVTTTAANPTVDISGWNTAKLSITPPATYSGTLTLQATATAAETVGGSKASVSQNLTVQVNAIAQTPSLTLNPPASSISRNLIDTSWEGVCDSTYSATVLDTDEFAGWSSLPVAKGKDAAFEVWGNGDLMQNAQGKNVSVNDASGAGQEWLGLTNGVGSSYQAPGIAQSINTISGAQYTFTLDYAGQLGLTSANTQIGVYLDGTLLGTYSNTSTTGLNWQALSYSFKGDGASHTLSVQLINGTNSSTPRGAMIDALNLTETLPQSASTVYGFAGSTIALPKISDQLAATDMGDLETTLVGLPVGVTVSDGKNSVKISSSAQVVNVSGWNLNALSVTVPGNYGNGSGNGYGNGGDCGDGNDGNNGSTSSFNLQVVATSIEPGNGTTASIAKNVTVQLLSGQACSTPAGVNPYVSYANSQALTQSSGPAVSQVVVASALVPVASSYATASISSPSQGNVATNAEDLDASMEALLANLSESLGAALSKELGNLTSGNI